MANYILVESSGRPSAKALFREIGKGVTLLDRRRGKNGQFFRVYKDGSLRTYTTVAASKLNLKGTVVRWGNRVELPMQGCVIYNTAAAVGNAANKKRAREILQKAGIDIPKLVTPQNFENSDLPIIARPSYHFAGKNVVILKTKDDFLSHYKINNNKGWYYSKVIWKDREIRVHCAHGKVLLALDKSKPKDKNCIAWNLADNEVWTVIPWEKYVYNWCKKALAALEALGLDFGAVDMVIKDGKSYVLEVNTSAGLGDGDYTKKRYAMYMKWLFRKGSKREHWDYKKLSAGNSLAWKNYQLLDEPNG